ncbi:MAG: DUF2089 family protein [Eubacteriales bacterium]|nr:DUF2089 family protein [Eubacteriales bacterium]
MEWFSKLDDEDQCFIKVLVLNSGSLKHTAKEYGVSYPTIRLRLDRLQEKIKINDSVQDPFETQIMHMVLDEQISLEVAKQIITAHQNSGRNSS